MSSERVVSEAEWVGVTAVLSQAAAITAAWVFGSAEQGVIREGSDLDVGVLWRETPSFSQLLALQQLLQRALCFEDIDLVTLNDASSILRFAAVSGRRLYCGDEGETAVFVSLTAREYEDDMAMIQRALQYSHVTSRAEGLANYLEMIRGIVQPILSGVPCQAYLFGSRATGADQPGSNVDIAIMADRDVSYLLRQARLTLEESTIPYKVDLVDLSQTSADFRRQALAEGILLWQN